MKRLLVFLLSSLMAVVLLTGCGSDQATNGAGEAKDIAAIKDHGVLKVGVKVDVPKFGFKDPQTNKIDGLEIDIARAVAQKIFGDPSKIEVQGVTAKTRGPLLDNGEIDLVIATFTITEERKQSYNFSEPYFVDGVRMMVKKNAGIQSIKDLNGKKIGVAQSATTRKVIQDETDKAGVKVEFLEFGTYPEIKTALDAGRVNVFSVDGAILAGYLDDSTVILDDKFATQQYGIASKKSNTALAKLVDETIAEMKKSGELDKLIKKWGIR
ncbi:MAG: peb1A [Firmicutes bacterium]|nr:peb1A [Bacillota bacterium]